MKARLALFVIATLTLFCLGRGQPAFAEPTESDQRVLRAAQQNPTAGMVFMEVKFLEDGRTTPKICQKIWVFFASDQGKAGFIHSQISPTLFGHAAESSRYGGVAVLLPGVYTITSLWCEGSTRFPGPFARFAVQTGQASNLGCLVIDYKHGPFNPFIPSRASGEWKVEDLSPNAIASLGKQVPVAFSKASKRYMTAVRAKPKPPQ